jgi:hypothetical protein
MLYLLAFMRCVFLIVWINVQNMVADNMGHIRTIEDNARRIIISDIIRAIIGFG